MTYNRRQSMTTTRIEAPITKVCPFYTWHVRALSDALKIMPENMLICCK